MEVNPVNMFPQNVAFAPYTGSMPRQRLDPAIRFKIRKYDESPFYSYYISISPLIT